MMEACIEIATIISMGRNRIKTNTKTAVNIQVNNVYNPYMCSLSSLFHISKDFTSRKRDEEKGGGECIRKGLFVFFLFFFDSGLLIRFPAKKKKGRLKIPFMSGFPFISCRHLFTNFFFFAAERE